MLLAMLSLPASQQTSQLSADNLSKAGWSWGCVSAIDATGRTIWIADAHRFFSSAISNLILSLGPLHSGQAISAQQKTKKAEQEQDHHVIKASTEVSMQHLVLLAAVSMMVLYMLTVVGCLCYVGRHRRRIT